MVYYHIIQILGKKYESIFDECKNSKNVNYLGFLENKKIIELLKKMHIFSYPSIWPETSCIAAIESMGAGCEVVTTNLGALFEYHKYALSLSSMLFGINTD